MHGRDETCVKILVGIPEGNDDEDLGIDRRIILKFTLRKIGCGLESLEVDSCEPSGSRKCREFLY
jgi:hypothetical protein